MLKHMHITPRYFKSHLDQFVVSQLKAKRILSVAVYNHYLRIHSLLRRRSEENDLFRDNVRSSQMNEDELSEVAHETMTDFPGQTSGKSNTKMPWPAAKLKKRAEEVVSFFLIRL